MEIYFIIISLAYCAFCISLIIGWERIPFTSGEGWENSEVNGEMISVIIAVRNEAENVEQLIKDLCAQTYAKSQFEVIFVDDHSTDGTGEIIQNWARRVDFRIIYLISDYLEEHAISPKKYALNLGIKNANGSIFLMTDGDCRVGPNWIKVFARTFSERPVRFVAGPVSLMAGTSLLDRFQEIDFASLIGTGAASIAWGYPLMCNGANLAYRRNVLEEIQSHNAFDHLVSGDDVFLMQQVHRQYPGAVVFIKSREALVQTTPQPDIKSFVDQRRRWAGKWHKYLFSWARTLPVFIFGYHLSVAAALVLALCSKFDWILLDGLLLGRMLPEYLFLRKILFFQGKRLKLHDYFIAVLLYPLYAIFFGVWVNVKGFEWKGRKYNTDGNDRPGI